MEATNPQGTRPVQLQVKAAGAKAWHALVDFDAADVDAEAFVRDAASQLSSVDERVQFRVITRDALATVLLTYTHLTGWTPA